MKKHLLLLLFTLTCFWQISSAQSWKELSRLDVDTALAPFYHGVASGDPLTDRVIIWTRVTTQQSGPVTVNWRVATDTTFSNIVVSGTTTADTTHDYTVKVDVTGLQAGTWYYYQFEALGRKSLTGRMKTVPATTDHERFAVVSCADYRNGYFNAYGDITPRNDIDAVIHLGDYIYEYGDGSGDVRVVEPDTEIIHLADYRARYAYYHLDPQLRALHQQYCFITVWDDHETANNSWEGGAENHDPATEGDWETRKYSGKEAYFDWMPIRQQPAPNEEKIYRTKFYGDLAQIIFLDTRLEGREEQSTDTTVINDTSRTILGTDQYNWFIDRLKDTTAQWKIVAQQIMIAPLLLGHQIINDDQWDDYPAERGKIYNHILQDSIHDVAVLTGDIHSAWANNLRVGGDSGDSVGVEFVTTSITSQGFQGLSVIPASTIQAALPHVKYIELAHHGYYILDITRAKTQADYYIVDRIDTPGYTTSLAASWYENHNERFLRSGSVAAGYADPLPPLAPTEVQQTTGLDNGVGQQNVVILGAYPNPSDGEFMIQFFLAGNSNVHAQVFDLSGKKIMDKTLSGMEGVNYTKVNLRNYANGDYILVLTDGQNSYHKLLSKSAE